MTNGEPAPEHIIEPLNRTHDRAAFLSGVEPLDRYLHTQARQDADRLVARVYVLVPTQDSSVIGYYTLSAVSVAVSSFPAEIARRLPHYPEMPATLIGRLAVDQRHRGQHLGERLLFDAFDRSLQASAWVASVAIIVDAKDDSARHFYERFDFRLMTIQGLQERLFLPMATVARLRTP